MPIRIRILSGSQQGQVLEFDQNRLQIGSMSSDDVVFDPGADPGIEGRQAVLEFLDGRWRIHSTGSQSIFVNQDYCADSSDLKAGDLIRLSYDGPDLSFEPFDHHGAIPAAEVIDTERPSGGNSIPIATGVVAILSMILVALLVRPWFSSRETEVNPPEFQPFGVINVNEGESLFWRAPLMDSHSTDQYSLGDDAPDGMTVDPRTGTIRWDTSEEDGPSEVACQIIITRMIDEQLISNSKAFEVRVQEVNRPPVAKSFPTQIINLRESNELRILLDASDPDIPRQRLSYQLQPQAPAGVSLDPITGDLSWTIDSTLESGEYFIPYRVADDSGDPQSSEGIVRVRVDSPEPWSMVEQELQDSIYLLVARTNPGNVVLPIGTGCAIGTQSLLTSATVGTAADQAVKRGWDVLAIDTRRFDLDALAGIEIEEVKLHAIYVHADSIEDARRRGLQQAYFDLAVLTTDTEMRSTCRLGDVEASVKNNQVVACFGYEIHGTSLSKFDEPKPVFEKTKILEVISPQENVVPNQRPPLLLQLVGELPFQVFGGVIVNQQAEVLGVYAFRGELTDESTQPPVHYAPETLQAKAYLSGQGRDQWIEPVIQPSAGMGKGGKPTR